MTTKTWKMDLWKRILQMADLLIGCVALLGFALAFLVGVVWLLSSYIWSGITWYVRLYTERPAPYPKFAVDTQDRKEEEPYR